MIEWINQILHSFGAFGIFLLMLLENIFPPIPSEVILPISGMLASHQDMNIMSAFLAATAGSVLGAVFWYYIGLRVGKKRIDTYVERHSAWLGFTAKEYQKTARFFEKHSRKSVFFARMIPAFRTLISIPAGIIKMPLNGFLFYTILGSMIWNALLLWTGYTLKDDYVQIEHLINLASKLILGTIIVMYFYRLGRMLMKKHS